MTVTLALKSDRAESASSSTFSKLQLAPSVDLPFPAGKMALHKFCFFVPNFKDTPLNAMISLMEPRSYNTAESKLTHYLVSADLSSKTQILLTKYLFLALLVASFWEQKFKTPTHGLMGIDLGLKAVSQHA